MHASWCIDVYIYRQRLFTRLGAAMIECSYWYYCTATFCYLGYILTALFTDGGTRKTYIAGIVNLISVCIPLVMKAVQKSEINLLLNLALWWFASFSLAPCVFLGIKSLQNAENDGDYSSVIFFFWFPFVLPNFLCVWLWRTILGFIQFLTPWT